MNEKVAIEVFGRRLTIEIEGFTPLEIAELAKRVDDKMREIADQNKTIADSSKLAILTAIHLSAELYQLQQRTDTEQRALDHKVEELTLLMQSALSASRK
jgi:cell division protein ZapA (FtsZ GTPase activity inhibitor)